MAKTGSVSVEDLTAGVLRWVRNFDRNRQAAVVLLIEHGHWLRTQTFRTACMDEVEPGVYWINFGAAREAFDDGRFNRASTTELAILDLAIALGEDRYRTTAMGHGTGRLIHRAMAVATGNSTLSGEPTPPPAPSWCSAHDAPAVICGGPHEQLAGA